jgi:putative ABC transport system permease protein
MPDQKHGLKEETQVSGNPVHRDDRAVRELADHLEDLYQETLDRGATDDEARVYVEERLGETAEAASELLSAVREKLDSRMNRWAEQREDSLRSQNGLGSSAADRLRDLRLAFRGLVRCPLFTGVAVFVLALGIGASVAIFTLVDAIVLSPLPFEEADRLIAIGHSSRDLGLQNAGQCAAWHLTYEEENEVFDEIGMWDMDSAAVTGGGPPDVVSYMQATSGVFRALRLEPVLGRSFTSEDEVPGEPYALLLSYGYWQSRYGGDAEVLNRTLEINGRSWEIVGVMPPMLRSLGDDPDLILPMRFDRETLFVGNIGQNGVARLRDGVTLEQATADMARMLPMAWEKFPGGPVASTNERSSFAPIARPLKDDLVGSAADLLWILLGSVSIVLLIAVANVANLFLVRAEAKETEMAVRTAIGANRGHVAWEFLKESLLLGLSGGVVGLGLAWVCIRVLIATNLVQLPRLQEVTLGPTVLLFTLAVSMGGGLFLGLFPVLRRGRAGLIDALKQGGQGAMSGRDRRRAQNALAVSQMALTLVLLVASGLMLRSFLALRHVKPGFDKPTEVLALRINVPSTLIEDREQAALTLEAIARRLAEIPGVDSVGMATAIPMDGSNNVNPFYVDGVTPPGEGPPPMRRHKWIGEGYFETLQIPLLAGRTFSWMDVHERFPGAIVSESLARAYWGSPGAALGQRVAARPEPVRWHEVVGVVADVRDDGVDQAPPLMVYWPQVTLAFWEGSEADQIQTWRTMGYAIRSDRVGTPGLLRDVRDAVWEVNPNLPLRGVSPLDELMTRSVQRTSSTMILLSIAGVVALILGVVGVYGVTAYAVARRSRELGMRIALGAQKETVMGMVLRQGFVLAVVGVAIGLALALGLTRLMSTLLYGVSPADPITFAIVAIGLLGVALLASYLPARRAAGVDPMNALRVE